MYAIDLITHKKVKIIQEFDTYFLVEHLDKKRQRYKLPKNEIQIIK